MMAESFKREHLKKTKYWASFWLSCGSAWFHIHCAFFVTEVVRSSLRFKCPGHRHHFSKGGFSTGVPTMNTTKFKGNGITTYSYKNGFYLLRNDSSKPLSCFLSHNGCVYFSSSKYVYSVTIAIFMIQRWIPSTYQFIVAEPKLILLSHVCVGV